MPPRRKIPLRLRRQVIERAEGRCEYCRAPEAFSLGSCLMLPDAAMLFAREYCRAPEAFSLDSFTVDHIQPIVAQGIDTLDNLAYACHNCNNRKQDDIEAADPETGRRVSLYHPRQDNWRDHFAWSDDTLTIIPLSPTGRASVARLQLNRLGAMNVRRALIALREPHPPLSDL